MTISGIAGVARAPFLLLPVALVAAGTGAAARAGGADLVSALIALVGLAGLHAAVNALNEWSDHRRGIDFETERTPFSGGSGTLPAGRLSPCGALVVAGAGFSLGLAAGAYFLVRIGWPMVPIVAFGAFSVLAYTDFLARIGVGELFAGLGLGALPVIGTALVQAGRIPPEAWIGAFPACAMTFNLLLLNEFPDEAADRRGGRRNLVLLLGRRGAALVYAGAALSVPACLGAGVAFGLLPLPALAAAAPTLLLVPALRWAFTRPAEPVPLPALGANVAWNLLTNVTFGLALGTL
ncbi:MAG: prenyltransferase [Planctomycetes bacterium]|jgi:1,4-dihydroxy-2-naphthoate octaprenyltransferase|nr:prenyltransferase [Planctomycetota bacterium]